MVMSVPAKEHAVELKI